MSLLYLLVMFAPTIAMVFCSAISMVNFKKLLLGKVLASSKSGIMDRVWSVKQECFNRRNNIKFFGISDNEQESPEYTEAVLRNFLHKEMKFSKKHLDEIEFERVHRIPTRAREEKINQHPRPIIAKVSFFKDKQQIKSHIKHLPRGKSFGVADDFPKEVDEIRKELHPVLKQAKRDHKMAFFNVERLIIDKAVYRGPETRKFTLYGQINDNT